MRLAAIGMCLLLASCGDAAPVGPLATNVALPGPPGEPPRGDGDADSETLPGVDLASFSRREREQLWRLLKGLYTPCPDQAVSLATCVREARACSACTPATQLLAKKVREGASFTQGQAIYAARFGPATQTVDTTGSPSRGPANAPVTVAEWFDFECPHCRLASPLLDEIAARHPNDVRIVKKFYPLHQHSRADPAARASIAANAQGKYWEMEKLLFGHQSALSDQDLLGYATSLGLDVKRFQRDMDAEATTKLIGRDHDEAEKAGLDGTPFILVNGRPFNLSLFHLEGDLDAWISLEIQLVRPITAPVSH